MRVSCDLRSTDLTSGGYDCSHATTRLDTVASCALGPTVLARETFALGGSDTWLGIASWGRWDGSRLDWNEPMNVDSSWLQLGLRCLLRLPPEAMADSM